MADAEAICEAAQRPAMRFVAVKTEEQQARGMLFRTRDLLVRQRTQTINALRGHLAEYGVVAPQCEQVGGRVRANGRSRRDRENQLWGMGLSSPQYCTRTRSAHLHTGPRHLIITSRITRPDR